MSKNATVKIEPEDRKLLKLWQVEHDLPTLSAAIRELISRAEGVTDESRA